VSLPGHAQSSTKLADAFKASYASEAAGKYLDAFQAIVQVLQGNEDNYVVVMRLGYLKGMMGEYQEAARLYGSAAALKPDAVEPLVYQQYQFLLMTDWSALAASSREALKRDTQNYSSRSRLGYALYNMGRYSEAGENYSRVSALYPLDLEALTMRGWCYARLNRKGSASQLFREVLTISPDYQSAKDGLAYLDTLR
ncbi:MAG: tetratricopeptide repeat protein, partial [Candidatus Hydrogenedentota bacterium]